MKKLASGRWVIASESSPDKEYIVVVKRKGAGFESVTCSCPGWIYHRKCKHVTAVKNGEYVAA